MEAPKALTGMESGTLGGGISSPVAVRSGKEAVTPPDNNYCRLFSPSKWCILMHSGYTTLYCTLHLSYCVIYTNQFTIFIY